jgi:hypothetical protein
LSTSDVRTKILARCSLEIVLLPCLSTSPGMNVRVVDNFSYGSKQGLVLHPFTRRIQQIR